MSELAIAGDVEATGELIGVEVSVLELEPEEDPKSRTIGTKHEADECVNSPAPDDTADREP